MFKRLKAMYLNHVKQQQILSDIRFLRHLAAYKRSYQPKRQSLLKSIFA